MPNTITTDLIERLKTHLAGAVDEVDEADSLYQELQGLLTQPEGEPAAWTWDTMGSGGMSGYRMAHFQLNKPEKTATMFDLTPLYTHPAPFTPITADTVTDEVVMHLWSIGLLTHTGVEGKKVVQQIVNAWGAKK